MKSTEVGQEGGTTQAKMIKIGAANGCSPPVSNLNTTHNTGMRIRVWIPVQVVPDVTGTNQLGKVLNTQLGTWTKTQERTV